MTRIPINMGVTLDAGRRWRHAVAAARRVDWSKPGEWLVLYAVLGIAALISYTHLRFVWAHLHAPWPDLGPLTVDGLFAAAWLRMRRRRRDGVGVGPLAWFALVVAFVATLGGNVAAAFPTWLTEHREAVAPLVYAWPAIAFAVVWELVTGHARRVTATVTQTVTAKTPAKSKAKTAAKTDPKQVPVVTPPADEQPRTPAAIRAWRYRQNQAAKRKAAEQGVAA